MVAGILVKVVLAGILATTNKMYFLKEKEIYMCLIGFYYALHKIERLLQVNTNNFK